MSRRAWVVLPFAVLFLLSPLGCEDDDGGRVPDGSPSDAREAGSPDMSPDARDMGGSDMRDGPAGDGPAGDGPAGDGPAGDGPAADGPALTERQQRGKYLVDNVIACPECHTPRLQNGQLDMSKYMAGDTTCFAGPPNDCLYVRNLTPHATGLGNRSDADIKKMFMEGLRPAATGDEPLHPIMPYYVFGNMEPEDADAIVAYLKVIPPVANTIPLKGASFVVTAPKPAIDMAAVPTPADAYENQQAAMRGRYLATQVGLCIECHTPHLMGAATELDPTKFFHGGVEFPIPVGPMMTLTARSKNLTPDTTGLGTWTVEDIVKALKDGKDKMDKGICPPMPAGPMSSYGGLAAQDARDIAHYLLSIPPATSMIMDMCTFPPGS